MTREAYGDAPLDVALDQIRKQNQLKAEQTAHELGTMLYQNKSIIERSLGDLVDSKGEASVRNVRKALETGLGMEPNEVDRVIYGTLS